MNRISLFGMVLIITVTLTTITGCESGSGSASLPEKLPIKTLSGNVVDAIITNADLEAFAWDNGVQGESLGKTTVDGSGYYELDIQSISRPMLLVVSNGRYTEEASGINVNMVPGQTLSAVIYYETDSDITVQINPFTHLATCFAKYKVKTGTNAQNAIVESISAFSALTGVDIIGTYPLNITDPENANFEVTDGLRFGALLAGISSFTAQVSIDNGVTVHRFNQNSSIYFTQVACQDIQSDGLLNGLGFINNGTSIGQLALGSVTLTTDSYRLHIAQQLLNIMSSDRNATSLDVSRFIQFSNQYAESTDPMFGDESSQAVDLNGPIITTNRANDSFLTDIEDIQFTVTDPIGVQSIEFRVNGVLHGQGNLDNPVLSINTQNYADGIITVDVIALDALNNESSESYTFNINNSSAVVDLTSPTLHNALTYTATGTYTENGASVTNITINNFDAEIDTNTNTWAIVLDVETGENTLSITVLDAAGNSQTINKIVSVDVDSPLIELVQTSIKTANLINLETKCIDVNVTNTVIENAICLPQNKLSLGARSITSDLINEGYSVLAVKPRDIISEIFTPFNELKVSYKLLQNNATIKESTILAVPASTETYYLPLVDEFLGTGWTSNTTDIFTLEFTVSDKAGNSREFAYIFNIQLLDLVGPDIKAVVTNNTYINNITDLVFNISDPTTITKVTASIDSNILNVSQDANNDWVTSFNSNNYPDGNVTILIKAENEIGVTNNKSFIYIIDNTPPESTVTTPSLTNQTNYIMSGSYISDGSGIDKILVNGVPASLNNTNNTWSANLALAAGVHNISIDTIDLLGNKNTITKTVSIDIDSPTIAYAFNTVKYTAHNGQYNLCVSGNLTTNSASSSPICIRNTRTSLGTFNVNGDLDSNDFVSLKFSPTDPVGTGVFTTNNNLVVDYQYYKGGSLKRDWSPVPINYPSLSLMQIPLVTEYLSNDWYLTTKDEIHKVRIRAVDEAGNIGYIEFELSFDIIVDDIVYNQNGVKNKSIFTGSTFDSRASIDSQKIDIEYTFTNPSNNSIYIKVNDAKKHKVTHTFESKIRRNRARLIKTEQERYRFSGGGAFNPTLEEWTSPLVVYDGLGQPRSSSTVISNGAFDFVNTDSLTAPTPSVWTAKTFQDFCDSITTRDYGYGTITHFGLFKGTDDYKQIANNSIYNINYAGRLNAGTSVTCDASIVAYGTSVYWESRNEYVYEIESGYPRNETNETVVESPMLTENIKIFNNSLGREISPINSWFLVKGNSTVTVIKSVRTPVLQHYIDSDVTLANFTSYSLKNLDKSTVWDFDTNLTFTRASDPGNVSRLVGVSQYTETIGNGIETFNISR